MVREGGSAVRAAVAKVLDEGGSRGAVDVTVGFASHGLPEGWSRINSLWVRSSGTILAERVRSSKTILAKLVEVHSRNETLI